MLGAEVFKYFAGIWFIMPNSPKKDLEQVADMVNDAENALSALLRKTPYVKNRFMASCNEFVEEIKNATEHIKTGTRFKAARNRYIRQIRREMTSGIDDDAANFLQTIYEIKGSLNKINDMLATLGDEASEVRELYNKRCRPQLEELLRSLEE
jgi:archaellum component FlaC